MQLHRYQAQAPKPPIMRVQGLISGFYQCLLSLVSHDKGRHELFTILIELHSLMVSHQQKIKFGFTMVLFRLYSIAHPKSR